MPAELTLDLSQCLVAYEGEVITCPACKEKLATFKRDSYGYKLALRYTAAAVVTLRNRGLVLRCSCGGRPFSAERSVHLRDTKRPRVHLSTGWRDLGGE